jgi:hypothetical protein
MQINTKIQRERRGEGLTLTSGGEGCIGRGELTAGRIWPAANKTATLGVGAARCAGRGRVGAEGWGQGWWPASRSGGRWRSGGRRGDRPTEKRGSRRRKKGHAAA